MKESEAVEGFSALAQPARLSVLRQLVKAGPDGLPAGTISARLRMPASSASFHLRHLEQAGLIQSKQQSRSIIYSASYKQLSALIRFLMEDCCAGDRRVLASCMPVLEKCDC